MFKIEINEKEAKELFFQKVEEKLKHFDADLVFWDSNELKRRTCLSWNTIQKEFLLHWLKNRR